ncbi:unnamed protein product, partial [Ectocarpus sp. 13 AM-2016]
RQQCPTQPEDTIYLTMTAVARNASVTTGGDSILFRVKIFIMVFLTVIDMTLNSSVEHETFGTWDGTGRDGTALVLILGFQLVVQVGNFACLFLMMFETYPFRVGLMGMLTSQYLTVYVINVLYFVATACVYGYRVAAMVQGEEGMGIWQVWDLRCYLPLSIFHKIGECRRRRLAPPVYPPAEQQNSSLCGDEHPNLALSTS